MLRTEKMLAAKLRTLPKEKLSCPEEPFSVAPPSGRVDVDQPGPRMTQPRGTLVDPGRHVGAGAGPSPPPRRFLLLSLPPVSTFSGPLESGNNI